MKEETEEEPLKPDPWYHISHPSIDQVLLNDWSQAKTLGYYVPFLQQTIISLQSGM